MQKRETMEDLLKLAQEVVDKANADAKVNPKSDKIQILVVEPLKTPFKKTIKNDLDAMKEIVDGYIEVLPFGKTETGGTMAITLNEEGKLIGLPFNRKVNGRHFADVLVGTFFVTAYNMQGDNITLTDEQCEKLMKKFKGLEVYL
jgi:hypothetical protein